jgi:hypothetical protein
MRKATMKIGTKVKIKFDSQDLLSGRARPYFDGIGYVLDACSTPWVGPRPDSDVDDLDVWAFADHQLTAIEETTPMIFTIKQSNEISVGNIYRTESGRTYVVTCLIGGITAIHPDGSAGIRPFRLIQKDDLIGHTKTINIGEQS